MASEATDVTVSPEPPGLADIAPGAPTPIGRRLDEPPRTGAMLPPPVPAPPPVVRAPGSATQAPQRHDTPAEGIPAVDAPARPRLARLYVARINPWSVMKVGFMLSVALAVVIITAVAATWWVLDFSGTFLTVARTVDDIIGAGTVTLDVEALFAFERVFGASVVIAAVEIVLVSVLAGLFAMLYNLTVGITGGVEVTFSDAV